MYRKIDKKIKIWKWSVLDFFIFLYFPQFINIDNVYNKNFNFSLFSFILFIFYYGKVSHTEQGDGTFEYNIKRSCALAKSISFSGPLLLLHKM